MSCTPSIYLLLLDNVFLFILNFQLTNIRMGIGPLTPI